MISIQNGVVQTANPGLESPCSELVKRVIEAMLRQATIQPGYLLPSVYACEPSLSYRNVVHVFPITQDGKTPVLLLMKDASDQLFEVRFALLTPHPNGEVVTFTFPPEIIGHDEEDLLGWISNVRGGQIMSNRPYSMPHLPEF